MRRIRAIALVLPQCLGAALVLAALLAPAPALAVPEWPGPLRAETLPAPCDGVLDRAGLGRVLGLGEVETVWDIYYARYAQTCRHEAIWPGAAGDTTVTIAEAWRFWEPILLRLLADGLIAAMTPPVAALQVAGEGPSRSLAGRGSGSLGGGGGSGGIGGFGGPGGGGAGGPVALTGPAPTPTGDAAPVPTAVPLPAPAMLLLAALAALGLRRRRA